MSIKAYLTKHSDRIYSAMVSVYVALNAFDLFTTLALVSIKVAEEVNPIMNYFLTKGPLTFGAVKVGATIVVAYAFWKIRQSPSAWWTLGISVAGYTALVIYQTYLINQLFQALSALVPQ